jgi:hypothetical protein
VDTARQILRFSIPGSLLFLHAFVCLLLVGLIEGSAAFHSAPRLNENSAVIVAVLATIPIGFVVYQIYYFSYGPIVSLWPFEWGGRIVRADRGWLILSFLEGPQITALETVFKVRLQTISPHRGIPSPRHWYRHPLRKLQHLLGMLEVDGAARSLPLSGDRRRRAYEHSWHMHWNLLQSILDIAGAITGGEQIKREYTTLSDIYHALGATRIAIILAGGGVFIWTATHAQRAEQAVDLLLALAVIVVLTGVLSVVLHVARRRTWDSASWTLRFGLRWLFWRHADELVPPSGRWGAASRESRAIRDALRSVPRRPEGEERVGQPLRDVPSDKPCPEWRWSSWGGVLLAVLFLIAMTIALIETGSPDGTRPGNAELILLLPGALGSMVGFALARGEGPIGTAHLNLPVAATGAFATIWAVVLIFEPTTIGTIAICAGSCLALTASAWLGGVRQRST